MTKSLQFLSGGGEMGALMRAYDWESSSVGLADQWPQSLRTTLGILLNSKFPMFLYWGPDLVCFYNDAYRHSLGNDGKHPFILGMKGEEAWKETWHIVKPIIDQVLTSGEATWNEDQLIPIYRRGKIEDAYWTFSFSPINNESNQTTGVFLTLIETTEKVNNLKNLIETNDQYAFAIDASELGTFDFNPLTNKFIGNNRLKDWFGLPHQTEFELRLAIYVIVEKDRSRVVDAVQKTLQYESGGLYDIEYSIINPLNKQERIVRAKGKAWFGEDKKPYRFNGTLQDITQQALSKIQIEESEHRFRNLILQAPVAINTFIGPSFIVETINKTALEIWDKSYDQIINKSLFDSSPELAEKVKTILNDVFITGEPFITNEMPVQLKRTGKPDTAYFNTVYQPLRDLNNKIYGIITLRTEVTEAVNARKLIEESEKRISNILSQSVMSVGILKGADMVVTLVNEPLLKIWGKGPEIVGKPLFEVMPELAGQGFWKQLNDVFTTGIPYTFNENRAVLMNNGIPEERFFSVVIQPYTEVDDTITGVTVIGTEVTDYVKAKKQIEESEEKQKKLANHLKLATDAANIGIWSLNIFSSKLEWSDIHKKLWGYDEDFEDLTYEDWHKVIEPEDKELAFQKIDEAKVNDGFYEVEYRINKADDHTIRFMRSIGKYYYNDQGEAETLTGISVDITEQKAAEEKIHQSEERFRTLAETIPQLIWITNEKGEYEYASRQWMKYSGLDPHFEETWQKLVHPDDLKGMMATWGKSLATGKPYQAEARLKNKQGEYLWHMVHGIAILNQENEIVKWIGAFTDIHEQKEKEHQKDEFISIASHEMKTPLTTAKGYLKLLLRKLSEENETAFLYANKSNQAVERLHSLVTELLDASKIQNGKLDYNLSLFNFNEMVDEAIENIQLTAKNHSLQKIGNSLHQIKGDKNRLQQVMINLLSNAVKYSPKADKIFIKVEELNGNIQVSVQDFGVGMLNQHLNKVFDRYYRVQEHAVHFPGLGIGLYISSNIIQRHEGKMWVDSEPNKGSTFYFTLPI
jgi:PAS domain S-box-containing protein